MADRETARGGLSVVALWRGPPRGYLPVEMVDEDQHLCDGAVEELGDVPADVQRRQHRHEIRIFVDVNVVRLGDFDYAVGQ